MSRRPSPEPPDPPMTPFAVAGTAIWAALGLGLLPFRGWLADHGHTWWLWTCLAGVVIGLVGIATMAVHDRNRRRRRQPGRPPSHGPADAGPYRARMP